MDFITKRCFTIGKQQFTLGSHMKPKAYYDMSADLLLNKLFIGLVKEKKVVVTKISDTEVQHFTEKDISSIPEDVANLYRAVAVMNAEEELEVNDESDEEESEGKYSDNGEEPGEEGLSNDEGESENSETSKTVKKSSKNKKKGNR